jgi:DnaJ-class molecular chaperone
MPCPACDGRGERAVGDSFGDGRLLQAVDCPTCAGRGRLLSEPCPGCDGGGVTRVWQSAEIRVPPGATDGQRLPLYDGAGEFVVVRVLDAAPDNPAVRYVALLALLVALVFLWLLIR